MSDLPARVNALMEHVQFPSPRDQLMLDMAAEIERLEQKLKDAYDQGYHFGYEQGYDDGRDEEFFDAEFRQ